MDPHFHELRNDSQIIPENRKKKEGDKRAPCVMSRQHWRKNQ
jgi:hypothetical protein